jgi:hypothetical protein
MGMEGYTDYMGHKGAPEEKKPEETVDLDFDPNKDYLPEAQEKLGKPVDKEDPEFYDGLKRVPRDKAA